MIKKILGLLLFLSMVFASYSQDKWKSSKNKIVIPFELTHNLIIITVNINDVALNMLLDTGSEKNLLFSFPENDSIMLYNTKKVKINGIGGGESIEAIVSANNKLEVKDYVDSNFELLLVTEHDINLVNKLGVPINGIIGATFFKDFLVEINYQNKKVILYKDLKNKEKKLGKYIQEEIDLIGDKPYIDIVSEINKKNVNLKLLIDTGLGDGLWLFENDTIQCNDKFFNGVLGRGLGGEIKGKKSRVAKLKIANLELKEALVSYPDSISFNKTNLVTNRNGSLGGGILKRFNWFLDYKNNLVYFKKNHNFSDPFNYNMSGIEIQHIGLTWIKEYIDLNKASHANELVFVEGVEYNYKFKLKPVFEIYDVREKSPADIAGLKVGDIIYSINGRKAFDYTIQKMSDLFQSEEGKLIKMEIERKGVRMQFKFILQKIL
ncbi:PDZ domain-containing protein [Flavobacterium sp. J27]|uniref:PDZ domain-containing protein n=1 Tax=Flavobacterium sp. J27 TaxID=2060419 RepID=UPI00102F2EBE|nr:PDZ domain-containing protein [Flavobacterium sp. J27]